MYKLGEALNSMCNNGRFLFRAHIKPTKINALRKYIIDLYYINKDTENIIHSVESINNTAELGFAPEPVWDKLTTNIVTDIVMMLRKGELEKYING